MLPEAVGLRAVRMGVLTQHTPWGGAECCGLWEGKCPVGTGPRPGHGAAGAGHSQHSMGLEATCSDSVRPLGCGMWTRKTSRTRVFFLPMSVSPLRSSMSEFLSFRIPAQSML